MNREPSQVVDELGVAFRMGRYGWSDLTLTTRQDEVACRVSSVFTDVVARLVDLCDALIEDKAYRAAFYDEPGGYAWTLTPRAAQRHTMLLQVHAFEHDGSDDEDCWANLRPRLELVVKRQQLATMLIGELWTVATLYREPSYQGGRERFPVEAYQSLVQRWEAWTAGQARLPGPA